MRKKIYIAGKVSGLPEHEVAEKFKNAQIQLEALGYETVNPIESVQDHLRSHYLLIKLSESEIWKIAMRVCIKELVDCDAVLLLPCFFGSKGALIESDIAYNLNIKVVHDIEQLEIWNSSPQPIPSR